jgi:hypothetical protein
VLGVQQLQHQASEAKQLHQDLDCENVAVQCLVVVPLSLLQEYGQGKLQQPLMPL